MSLMPSETIYYYTRISVWYEVVCFFGFVVVTKKICFFPSSFDIDEEFLERRKRRNCDKILNHPVTDIITGIFNPMLFGSSFKSAVSIFA